MTERLVLRPLRESDLDALAAIYADPQTMRSPDNVASQAVARRIGMHHERDLTFEGRPTSLFALQQRGQTPMLHGDA